MAFTLIDEMKTALQEKDMALVGKDVTIQSLRECVDKLEASAKTDAKVKEMFGALNTEVCHYTDTATITMQTVDVRGFL